MNHGMMWKRVRYFALFFCMLSLFGGTAYSLRYLMRKDSARWLMTYVPSPHHSDSPYSPWFHDVMTRIWVDIGAKEKLNDSEVNEVISYLELPFALDWADDGDPMSELENSSIFGDTLTIIATRIRYDRELTEQQRSRLSAGVVRTLDHPSASARHAAVQAVCSIPAIADGKVRSRVIAMQNDPDPKVASNAVRQLGAYLDAARRGKAPQPFE